jgi:hypothetical protein
MLRRRTEKAEYASLAIRLWSGEKSLSVSIARLIDILWSDF